MPGKKRKVASKPSKARKKRALARNGTPEGPQKYRQWSEDSMLGALKAVAEGMGVNRAALEFGVTRSTLKDRVSGRVNHGSRCGRPSYLTHSEEEELVD